MSKIKKYLLVTFVSAWLLQIIGSSDLQLDSVGGTLSFSYSLAFCMFMPTLGAFAAKADIREMGWRLHPKQNYKYILFAWLAPTLFQLAGAALYFLVFPGDLDLSGSFLADNRPEVFAELQASGKSYGDYIMQKIFSSLTSCYTFIGILMGLGEEIGWRGFLFPELDTYLGRTKAVLIGGVIHGVWHFPVILLAGYEYGTDYIGAPLLGMIAFCIFTLTTGIISYWLYERSSSIWLPAISHGMVNATFNPYMLRGAEHFERSVFGPVDIGLISGIPYVIAAAVILHLANKRERMEYDLFRTNLSN